MQNFLLVTSSSLGFILLRFSHFQRYCSDSDPTHIPPEFWGCSLRTRLPMLWLRDAKILM